jgi:hypothetical protein
MTVPKIIPCRCGCGGFASRGSSYVKGHNNRAMQGIRPAGMTLERALEIATGVYDRTVVKPPTVTVRDPESGAQPAPAPGYRRATAAVFENLVRFWEQGLTDTEIARQLGFSSRWVGKHRNRLRLPSRSVRGPRESA